MAGLLTQQEQCSRLMHGCLRGVLANTPKIQDVTLCIVMDHEAWKYRVSVMAHGGGREIRAVGWVSPDSAGDVETVYEVCQSLAAQLNVGVEE